MANREPGDDAEQALRARAKQELRTRLRSVRRVLPDAACAARSQAICARVLDLPAFAQACVVVGYAAFRKEADPAAVLRAAERQGKRVGLPRIASHGGLDLHAHADGAALEESGYGMLEPLAEAPRIAPEEVDLVLVPALAVDARGHRIGYGRGFYDRLLPTLARAYKVAIVYDFQLLAETPDTAGDARVDCVVTDARTLEV